MKYTNMAQFKEDDVKIRAMGIATSEAILTHLKDGLEFFHGEGNHNIQIVNDVLDTADLSRYSPKKVGEWLQVLCGHKFSRDSGAWCFSGKLPDTDYEQLVSEVPAFLVKHPDWRSYKAPVPEVEFDLVKSTDKAIKVLQTQMEKMLKNEYVNAATELATMIGMLEADKLRESYREIYVPEIAA